PVATYDRETVEHPPANSVEPAKFSRPRRDIVNGSGPHLTRETQAMLRLRLRAAAFILLIGFGVFLVRHVVGVLAAESLDPVLLGFHTLVVFVLGFSSLPLCRQCPVSMRRLRIAELVIFGLPALFFLLLQHRVTVSDAGRGFMPPPMSLWAVLIFTYGMFIPNTWRRAALVIGVLALAPVLLVVGMRLLYPEVAAVLTVADFIQHVLVMVIAAVAAVFGTYLINALRREAFEARQLGQYRLIAPLGAGGMGEVYLAEHRMLKRPCAIKLIDPERAGDPQVLARFEREVRMTARLSHWNTVEIFDFGRTDDGTFFYVMEYLPGLSLEGLLQRHGPLPAERVIHLLRQTCQGLREAHGIGLIHRDITPGNLFAAQRGGLYDVVKLLDFGLVKPVAEIRSARLTQDGAISGTPLFMSPEQARGLGDVDARSDIYSLGAVAYTLLCGRPPFERTSPLDVMIAHARDEVTPPSQLQADVPADLERVILRCLAKNREDRFQAADSLEQALAQCAAADQWTQSDAVQWWQENEPATGHREDRVPGRMDVSEHDNKNCGNSWNSVDSASCVSTY
ncbi:MAG TPA: serine/threonine-protein kinase, partial [Gemmataceae bacterium]|nr:serine/threonine-protein kinase [Gemmataceae bacterium]